MIVADPRDALLAKAIDYYAAHGVGNTSLRTLASAIGTSHRMLIYHFGSREGLLTAIVSHFARTQQAVLADYAVDLPTDPRAGAWRFWTSMVENSAITPLRFELSVSAMQGSPWAESFRENTRAWIELLSRYLVQNGVPAERAEVLARMSMAVARGTQWELAITGDREAADRTMRTFIDEAWPAGATD